MLIRKILGLILILLGVASLYFSHYISEQVEEGKTEIASGQKKVDIADSIFSLNPASKEIGKHFTDPAQKKIDAGSQKAEQYTKYAIELNTGGYVALVIGAGLFITGFIGKKRKSK